MAITSSSSYTRVEGISPAMMRQNGQSLSVLPFHSALIMNDVMRWEGKRADRAELVVRSGTLPTTLYYIELFLF